MDVKEIQPPTIAIGDKQINLDAVFPPGQRRIALYGVDSVREALEKAIGRDHQGLFSLYNGLPSSNEKI